MKITVIGSGYVGLVTAACFAEMGHQVVGVDIDKNKIALLIEGKVPIHEPGLSALITQSLHAGRLSFTTNLSEALPDSEVVFIAVGTPPEENGSADLSHVLAVAVSLGQYMQTPLVVVDKSTVPVGTADKVRAAINVELQKRGEKIKFAVISNPEFLKEGAAIEDFQRPDRIVLGGELAHDEWAIAIMRRLYQYFQGNQERIMVMDTRSAEMTKYAANAMLATRISFMNDMANLAEKVGADIEEVRRGIGSDSRIGSDFLYAGSGYGGSCFPKDVKAILHTAKSHNTTLALMQAVEDVNNQQKHLLVKKMQTMFGDSLSSKKIAIWGLAFKANTDDIRESSALTVIADLDRNGVSHINAYDPEAMPNTKAYFEKHPLVNSKITFSNDIYTATKDADVLLVMTEWRIFRVPNWHRVKDNLRAAVIFDGRNLYAPKVLRDLGFIYKGIGRL